VLLKIALILNDDFSMYHFRGGLIRALVKRGFSVTAIVPPGNYIQKIEALGARCIPVKMNRFVTPLRDLKLIFSLYKIFKREKFHIVHNMTIKPNIYGTCAAHCAGIETIVCLVSGSGFALSDIDSGTKTFKYLILQMYRKALSISSITWFQNADDFRSFIDKGLIKEHKGVVIRSGGINTDDYKMTSVLEHSIKALKQELKIPKDAKCVLMLAARQIWSKGVKEFVEAASAMRHKYRGWYFVMLCPKEDYSPDAVSQDFIEAHRHEQLIVVDKFRDDVKTFVAMADIMVLASYYPEGVPRSLLEGLSMGKPIITTNHTGCKEVVDEGKNGFLIPIKDSQQITERLEMLFLDDKMRKDFGKYSRKKAKYEFSEEMVVENVIRQLYRVNH
jgi:N,N'-diacetylbacillosaminyl-diphospho-undecaprenol alpha-1,3-N-acetylgalactosaminyltransferase